MLGIFDSGIGGLTVVREIKKRHPKMPIVYFGDTARVPWGNKSKKIVCLYTDEIASFLVAKGCDKIVIGCNTASALAGNFLRKKYKKIKFYDVIDPVVERIKNETEKEKNILVIGTRGTIDSGAYENKLNRSMKGIKIFSKACPLFVPLAEEGLADSKISCEIAAMYLRAFTTKKSRVNFFVLGCTHYPLLEKTLRKTIGKDVKIISSAREVAKSISSENISKNKQEDKYYFSDWTKHHQQLSDKILGFKIKIKKHPIKALCI